ncbi:TPA: hypothetical protein U0K44_001354 [Streptococcus suis]|nr:hypothetical protein [Streptococcus suis]
MPNNLPTKVQDQLAYLKYSEAFILDDFKSHVTKTPTLIIGVGGTGVKALVKTKHLYKTRYKESKHLYFYGIDTDENAKAINEKSLLQQTNLEDEEFFHLHSNLLAEMREPHKWTEEIKSFMPTQVGFDPEPPGAGGYRLAGRFLLFKHIGNLANRLREIIRQIRNDANVGGNEPQINIMILTGIAGGTGSGCSLDLAYLLRAILKGGFQLDEKLYSMNGYIILPDVNAVDAGNNKYLGGNGYAYLKELDYLNSLRENGELFEQKYTDVYRYSGNAAPFVPYLFSSEDAQGRTSSEGLDRVLGIVSESIMEFISDSIDKNGQTTKSVISNIDNNLKSVVAKADIECMKYRTFGSATYRLPLQEMTQYLFGLTFETLEPLFEENQSNPKNADFAQLFNDLNLSSLESTDNIHKWYKKGGIFEHADWKKRIRKDYSYDKVISLDEAKIYSSLRQDIYQPFQAVMKQVGYDIHDKNLSSAKSFYDPVVSKSFKEQLKNILNQAFVDPARGPIFVAKLFGFGDGGNPFSTDTLPKQAENMYKLAVDAERDTDKRIQSAEDKLAYLKQEEPKTIKGNIFDKRRTKEDIVEDYIETTINLVNAEAEKLYYQTFQKIYKGYGDIIDTVFRDIYRPMAEILQEMRENLKQSVQHLTSNYALQETSTIKFFVDLQNVLKSIKKEVDGKTDTQKQQLMDDFLKKYFGQKEKFIGQTDDIDIIGFVKEFLQEWYGKGILSTRLAAAIKREAGIQAGIIQVNDPLAQIPNITNNQLNDYLKNSIVNRIKMDSQPLIHLMSNMPAGGEVIRQLKDDLKYEQLALPVDSSADPIHQVIKNMNTINELVRTGDNSHISMLNFVYGFSLYMYSKILQYEDEYQEVIEAKDGKSPALHLFATKDRDWRQLPGVIPLDNWAGDTRKMDNKKTFYQYEEKSALFDRAVAYGIIKEEENDYILPVNNDMAIAKNTAVQRFMKMYENYKLIKALVDQEDAKRKAKDVTRWHFKVLLSGLIRPIAEGSHRHEVLLGGESLDLGNFLEYRRWKEYYMIQKVEEVLNQRQLQQFEEEVDEVYAQLSENITFDTAIAKLKEDVRQSKRNIIALNPDDEAAMLEFYEGLERMIDLVG